MFHSRWFSRAAIAATCIAGSSTQLSAVDAGPLTIHGAVSATAAISDRYNFLGETEGSPSVNVLEATLNGSHRFANGLTAAAQLYAYEVDNYSDLSLDFASLGYAFNEQVGVRAGRVKSAYGLYGEVQDLDMVRPFAFLPLRFYEKTLRPLTAAFDGVSLYGTFSLGAAGSLDYQIGYGLLPPVAADSPYVRNSLEGSLNRADDFDGDDLTGLWVFWNLPVDGFRVGFTRNEIYDFSLQGQMKSAADAAEARGDARLAPLAFQAGMWDLLIAGQPAQIRGDYRREVFSVEYTRGDWQFAAEYQLLTLDSVAEYPAPLGVQHSHTRGDAFYGMATWQATKRWQFGAYYSEAYDDRSDRRGRKLVAVPNHTAWLKDTAVAASYSATDWWLIKAEIHLLNGTSGVTAYNNDPVTTWKPDWTYFVLKSTISF